MILTTDPIQKLKFFIFFPIMHVFAQKRESLSEVCEVTVSVVKNRLSRAKKRLKAWGAAWEEANAEGLNLEFSEFNEKKGKS